MATLEPKYIIDLEQIDRHGAAGEAVNYQSQGAYRGKPVDHPRRTVLAQPR